MIYILKPLRYIKSCYPDVYLKDGTRIRQEQYREAVEAAKNGDGKRVQQLAQQHYNSK